MATRASITVRLNSKIRLSVYSHWGGYPDGVGVTLKEHYNSKAKALELVSYGDISSLSERVKPNDNEEHSFEKPLKDVTVFYGRDRGEEGVECEVLENNDIVNSQEFDYLFENNEWTVNGVKFKSI